MSKKRRERIIETHKLLTRKPLTLEELADELKCSIRTVRRCLQDMELVGYLFHKSGNKIVLRKLGLMKAKAEAEISPQRAARLFMLLLQIGKRTGIMFEDLRKHFTMEVGEASEYDDDIGFTSDEEINKVTAKTLQSDLLLLIRQGWIGQKRGYYTLRDAFLPNLPLLTEEVTSLSSILQEYASVSPYFLEMISIMSKVIATSRDKSSVMEDRYQQIRARRITTLGRSFSEEIARSHTRDLLDEAVASQRRVQLTYRNARGQITFMTLSPLGLGYNRYNNCWYVFVLPLDREGYPRALRVDRVQDIWLTNSRFILPTRYNPDEILIHPWGIGTGKAVKVKVLFEDIYSVPEKVRKQMMNRPKAHFVKVSAGFEYTDSIKGLPEFGHWLRQFGNAAEILEPLSLRKDFHLTARKTLDRYKELPRRCIE